MSIDDSNLLITNQLDKNLEFIKTILKDNQSIVYKQFESKSKDSLKFCAIFIKNLCDTDKILENILRPIMSSDISIGIEAAKCTEYLLDKILLTYDNNKLNNINQCINNLLKGHTVLFIEGCNESISIDTSRRKERAVTEPDAGKVTRGPREGFTEALETNIALIQQRIHSSDLKIRYLTLGRQTKTEVCITYIKDIASAKILDELIKRLSTIEIDGILDSNYIAEFINDAPISIFPTTGYTDRPDIACAKLLEGRIVLLCNGSPDAITLPYLFLESFQSNEDYYKNFSIASFYRILRYISFFITCFTPAIYLSMVTYHQELIPTNLLYSIMAARNSVPFPTIFELLIMLLIFEILIEAARRLPPNIGPTVSIVGGLILGEAAVSARLVSAPIIIITGVSGTTSFLLPFSGGPIIFIRVFCLAFSAILGLYGFIFSLTLLTVYMLSLRSFGVPYTLGLSTFSRYDIQDTLITVPWWYMKYRPRIIAAKNIIRQNNKKKLRGDNA